MGIGMALPVVLQATVDGQLFRLTVHPVSYVMTFTLTLVPALWGERKVKKPPGWDPGSPSAWRPTIQHRKWSEGSRIDASPVQWERSNCHVVSVQDHEEVLSFTSQLRGATLTPQ